MVTQTAIPVELNGEAVSIVAQVGDTLMEALRQHGIWSVKHGCESGECGACAVIVDGTPRPTCIMLAEQARGRAVTTLESLGTPERLHPLQEAFVQGGAVQCGFCTPSMILAAASLIARNPTPTRGEVCDALSGALCRCTGYVKPVEAVMRAAEKMREVKG